MMYNLYIGIMLFCSLYNCNYVIFIVLTVLWILPYIYLYGVEQSLLYDSMFLRRGQKRLWALWPNPLLIHFLWSAEYYPMATERASPSLLLVFHESLPCIWAQGTYILLCFSLEILLLRRYRFVLMLFFLYWMNKNVDVYLKPRTCAVLFILCQKFNGKYSFEAETSSVCNIPFFGLRKPNHNICNSIFFINSTLFVETIQFFNKGRHNYHLCFRVVIAFISQIAYYLVDQMFSSLWLLFFYNSFVFYHLVK